MTRAASAIVILVFCASAALPISAAPVALRGTVVGPGGAVPGAAVSVEVYPLDLVTRVPPTTIVRLTADAAGAFSTELEPAHLIIRAEPPSSTGLQSDHLIVNLREAMDVRLIAYRPITLAGRLETSGDAPQLVLLSMSANRRYDLAPGMFEAQVPADVYAILERGPFGNPTAILKSIDARGGDVRGIVIRHPADRKPLTPSTPPIASRITVGEADASHVATISGAAGAVAPLASLLAANLYTGQVNWTVSNADGSFSLPLFAPAGAAVLIKHDPSGRYATSSGAGFIEVPPGTIVHVPQKSGSWMATAPVHQPAPAAESITLLQALGTGDQGKIVVQVNPFPATWTRGERVTLSGRLELRSRDLAGADVAAIRPTCSAALERIFDANGRQQQASPQFASHLFTPTGLPLQRFTFPPSNSSLWSAPALRRTSDASAETEWSLVVDNTNVPPGLYRPTLYCNVSSMPEPKRYFDAFVSFGTGLAGKQLPLPLVRIGNIPRPRLSWILGYDTFSNGSRGAVAIEDRERVGIASNVVINGELIVPLRDERSGQPIRYRLEPHLPLVSLSNNNLPDAPQVPLKFPSGSLTVSVVRPDGSRVELGSAPFAQSTSRTPIKRGGDGMSGASAHVTDVYQLMTLDPRFDYTFDRYGLHLVVMTGTVEDVHGNVYDGGGTYEVWVARPLDLEFAVLPGTPFQVGNVIGTSMVIQPGVPADVQMTITHLPDSDPAKRITRVVRGRANRFGHLAPQGDFLVTAAGEYRIDVRAEWSAPDGTLWVGAATWGSIVETPGSPLVTHGRRGFDGTSTTQEQWFEVRKARTGFDHVMFPFHRGDVQWMQDDDPAAGIGYITVQDPFGDFAARVRDRNRRGGVFDPPPIEERITAGEIPLFSTTPTLRPTYEPESIDQWGYFYSFVERPGVRVREMVTEENRNAYWRFEDSYQFQLGNGAQGDLQNDFKFQFGGAVWRQPDFRYYGAYASLFVILPNRDTVGGRIFPPFQGNGGGPDGGPLLHLKGKAIDLFFHPTSVRAGTILQLDESASFTGYSAPTLSSKIEITLTSPSGLTRTIAGQANKVGYFHDPTTNVSMHETGVWRAKTRIVFDGRLPSGSQVQPPHPSGDVLGSRDGEYWFYVVSPHEAPLEVSASSGPFVRPAAGPITFRVIAPAGLTNIELHTTTTMPGFILEETRSPSLLYTYDATKLAADFPNLDLHDADGAAGSDTITISFLLSGTDGSGERRHHARQIVIQGEELQMPAQPAEPTFTKRRVKR